MLNNIYKKYKSIYNCYYIFYIFKYKNGVIYKYK